MSKQVSEMKKEILEDMAKFPFRDFVAGYKFLSVGNKYVHIYNMYESKKNKFKIENFYKNVVQSSFKRDGLNNAFINEQY